MKSILLLTVLVTLATVTASAQELPTAPDLPTQLEAVVPAQYAGYISLAVLASMILGRVWTALLNNGGLRGIWNAVISGTNTPVKLLIACLCLLALPSCATATAFLASPFGRAAFATADQLAKQVILTTEQVGLEQIILQAGSKVSTLKAEGVNSDLVKETLKASEIAGLNGVIEAAQAKYQQLTGHRFTQPKNPVSSVQ